MTHDRDNILPHRQSASWLELDLSYLGTGRRPAPQFPLSVLGSFWAGFVDRVALGASAPPDYVATTLLAVSSALLANVRWARAGARWSEPVVLWVCLVGSPGSGKSPAQDVILELLRHVEEHLAQGFDESLREYQLTAEVAETLTENWRVGVKSALSKGDDPPPAPTVEVPSKPERPRVRLSDITAEKAGSLAAALPRGLLLVRDEIAGWLGSFDKYGGGGSDRAFWLEAYGGRAHVIDRVKLTEPVRVPHLSIAVLGGIQPDRLAKIIAGPQDGFAARFLYVWPDVCPAFELMREDFDLAAAKTALVRLVELKMENEDE